MTIHFQPDHYSFQDDSQTVVSFLNSEGQLTGFYQAGEPVKFSPLPPGSDPAEIQYDDAGWRITDRLEQLSLGLYRCQREWRNLSNQPQEFILIADLYRPGQVTSAIIPAVSYNGNNWGNGQEPKGLVDPTSSTASPWVLAAIAPAFRPVL